MSLSVCEWLRRNSAIYSGYIESILTSVPTIPHNRVIRPDILLLLHFQKLFIVLIGNLRISFAIWYIFVYYQTCRYTAICSQHTGMNADFMVNYLSVICLKRQI